LVFILSFLFAFYVQIDIFSQTALNSLIFPFRVSTLFSSPALGLLSALASFSDFLDISLSYSPVSSAWNIEALHLVMAEDI
jgi:hypothetical protein